MDALTSFALGLSLLPIAFAVAFALVSVSEKVYRNSTKAKPRQYSPPPPIQLSIPRRSRANLTLIEGGKTKNKSKVRGN